MTRLLALTLFHPWIACADPGALLPPGDAPSADAPAGTAAPDASPVVADAPAVTPSVTPAVPPPSAKALTEDERNTIAVFKAATTATVFVTQTQVVVDFWSRRAQEVPAGTGSGFVWDQAGHVVTNYHVVDGGRSYTVTLHDGTELPATLVGGDPRKDVAVLKIAPKPGQVSAMRLPPDGYTLEVGQKTVAIGNPFGLDHTLTTGVVSALNREIEGYGGVTIRGMIQTDASINPGNSGGPLLDSAGQLVGMNTMIFSKSGSSAGIGFAVPVETVRRVVDQVITRGRVELVGFGIRPLDDDTARRIGVRGVAVLETVQGLPAATAGMRGFARTRAGIVMGDVIVRVDGQPVRSYDDLYTALDGRKVGEQVEVTYVRDGKEVTVKVPLVEIADGS